MTNGVSEFEFGQLFAKRFREGALSYLGYPRTSLKAEVEFMRGRPDFVCGDFVLRKSRLERFGAIGDAIGTESSATVLSLLKRKSGRSPEYLAERSGLSRSRLSGAIDDLRSARLIRVDSHRGHALLYAPRVPKPEICVFEIKLEKWRRAIYQATQYRAAAHRVAIVMPSTAIDRVNGEFERLRAFEIGLISLDFNSGELRTIVHPLKDKPLSTRHYYFALGKYLQSSVTQP
jgi:hypothetical protein